MNSVWFSLVKKPYVSRTHKFELILKGILGIRFVRNPYFVELRQDSTTWVISGKQFR